MKYRTDQDITELAKKYENVLRSSVDPQKLANPEIPISKSIYYNDLNAVKQRISDWVAARLTARHVFVPDWSDLIRVYDYVVIDAHVTGIINGIRQKVKGKEFAVLNPNGKINQDLTEQLKTRWFSRYTDYFIEAFFYPYSLIELGDYKSGRFDEIQMIKREYIVPQYKSVKVFLSGHAAPKYVQHFPQTGVQMTVTDPGEYALMYFEGEERINDYIFIECPLHDLGLLDMVSPHALGKMGSLTYFLDYLQKFVVPFRHGKTNINDNDRRKNMDNMMKAWGAAGYAVTDIEDEINILEQGGAAVAPFNELLKYSNNEISKALASAVGIFDEKNFVGSAEAGERMLDAIIQGYVREFEYNINDELFPRMALRDQKFSGKKFEYITKENIPYSQRIDAIVKLANIFKLDTEEVSEKSDFRIEEKEVSEASQQLGNNQLPEKREKKDKPDTNEKPNAAMIENAKRALRWVNLKKIEGVKDYVKVAEKIAGNKDLTNQEMMLIEGAPESVDPYTKSVDSVIYDLCGGKEGYYYVKEKI